MICFVFTPLGGIIMAERAAIDSVAAVSLTGLGFGAGSSRPIVAESVFNYAAAVGNFDACGCVCIKLTAGAHVIRLVARLGTGCGFSLNRRQVISANMTERRSDNITAF